MSYLRMYRDKFVESNDLEYIYMNQSLKFVDYMEQIGLGDKIVEIGSQQLKDSLSLGSLDVLLRRFEINIDEQSNIGEMINREISKFQFYQDI